MREHKNGQKKHLIYNPNALFIFLVYGIAILSYSYKDYTYNKRGGRKSLKENFSTSKRKFTC